MPAKIIRYQHPVFDNETHLDDTLRQVSGPKYLMTVEHLDIDCSAYQILQVFDLHADLPSNMYTGRVVCYVPRADNIAMAAMEEELQSPHFSEYHVHYYGMDAPIYAPEITAENLISDS